MMLPTETGVPFAPGGVNIFSDLPFSHQREDQAAHAADTGKQNRQRRSDGARQSTRQPSNRRANHGGDQRADGAYDNLVGRWLGHPSPPVVSATIRGSVCCRYGYIPSACIRPGPSRPEGTVVPPASGRRPPDRGWGPSASRSEARKKTSLLRRIDLSISQ